ncbi:hypothetical protein FIU88_06030 [Halomonas sp. THAF12]|uniref:hypothetical protein n=1 Tax=Halomonas TaxID=2745 RepID=UPI0002D6F72C|nr:MULTISPECIES: hypothetical protein [Halomonas]QFT84537.1 hypothetical protein FIU88_06030 [Halomonas sp. THAF12]
MTAYQLISMLGYAFHLVGLLVCLGGLSLARRPRHRWLGRLLAVAGFGIAATPLLAQLFGWVEPTPAGVVPPS